MTYLLAYIGHKKLNEFNLDLNKEKTSPTKMVVNREKTIPFLLEYKQEKSPIQVQFTKKKNSYRFTNKYHIRPTPISHK